MDQYLGFHQFSAFLLVGTLSLASRGGCVADGPCVGCGSSEVPASRTSGVSSPVPNRRNWNQYELHCYGDWYFMFACYGDAILFREAHIFVHGRRADNVVKLRQTFWKQSMYGDGGLAGLSLFYPRQRVR